jgi:hypothetical protein
MTGRGGLLGNAILAETDSGIGERSNITGKKPRIRR